MIDFIPVPRIYDQVKDSLQEKLVSVYKDNKHFQGKFCEYAQDLLKKFSGRRHAFLVTSGTSAIQVMLLAKEIKPNTRIGCINYSCPATVMPIMVANAKPVFFDIDQYGQQDINQDEPIDYLLATGLYGDTYDHEKAQSLGVPILNDSAQSFGAKYKGIESTKLGECSIVSFSTNKNCPIFGTYGAVLCDDDELAKKIALILRNGYANRDSGLAIQYVGINAQPHEDKAAQVSTSLEFLPQWQQRRKQIAEHYRSKLPSLDISIRQSPGWSETNNHKFTIFVNNKSQFRDELLEMGVECQLHYTYNFASTPLFQNTQSKKFTWTEYYRQHAISIPSNPWMTDAEVETVIQKIYKAYQKKEYIINEKN